MKPIELTSQQRAEAVASIRQYFEENLPEPIGDLPAGLLLDYVLQELAPVVYNRAIAEAQARLTQRVADLTGELFADEFQYWRRQKAKRRK